MTKLNITLRAVEPTDLDFLYQLENDRDNWEVSNTRIPFSKNTLQIYIESIQDIYTDKQLRMVIMLDNKPAGLFDWFDFDGFHQRAGIGIVVAKAFRNTGVGKATLQAAKEFSYQNLGLRLLFCNILTDNFASLKLFEGAGFKETGLKPNWHKAPDGSFKDEKSYQFNF